MYVEAKREKKRVAHNRRIQIKQDPQKRPTQETQQRNKQTHKGN